MRFQGGMRVLVMAIAVIGAAFMLSACAGGPPKWVEKGPGSMMKDGKAFYGVGAIGRAHV